MPLVLQWEMPLPTDDILQLELLAFRSRFQGNRNLHNQGKLACFRLPNPQGNLFLLAVKPLHVAYILRFSLLRSKCLFPMKFITSLKVRRNTTIRIWTCHDKTQRFQPHLYQNLSSSLEGNGSLGHLYLCFSFSSVQSLSCVRLFVTP